MGLRCAPLRRGELCGGIGDSAKGACFYGLRAGAGALPLYPTRASAALDPVRALGP